MKTQRIYLDTSVIGGCFDDEFEIWSNSLMKDIEIGLFTGVTSELVEAEIADAPQNVYKQFLKFLELNPEVLKTMLKQLDWLMFIWNIKFYQCSGSREI